MSFGCVFASRAGCVGAPLSPERPYAAPSAARAGWLRRAVGAAAGLDLPWRPRLARVADPRGNEGWVALLPSGAPEERVGRTLRAMDRRGAGVVSVSPLLGHRWPGLRLWTAAALRAALVLAEDAAGTPERALVVGAASPAGRLALAWLAPRVRYLSLGDAPAPGPALLAERLLGEAGVTVRWEPVAEQGPPWRGDLVVWAGEGIPPQREILAPVWVWCGPERWRAALAAAGSGGTAAPRALVVDALFRGVGMEGIPAWWWGEWGWPEGLLPAGGLEAALLAGGVCRARAARALDGVWRLACERGWTLAAAVLAPAGGAAVEPPRRGAGCSRPGAAVRPAPRVAWLTGMRGAHIIGDAVG